MKLRLARMSDRTLIMSVLEVGFITGAFVKSRVPLGRLAMQFIQRMPISIANGRAVTHDTYVAEDPDAVGFCVLTHTNQKEMDLHIFGVDPPLHRRGIGSEFLGLLLDGPLTNCTVVTCRTAPSNLAMIKLLERRGFKRKREITEVIDWELLIARKLVAAPQRRLLGPEPAADATPKAGAATPAVNVAFAPPPESGRLFQVPALTEPMQALIGFYAEPESWVEPPRDERPPTVSVLDQPPPRVEAAKRAMPPRALGERPDKAPPDRPVRGLGRLDEAGLGPVIQPTGLAGRHIEVRRRVYGRVLVSGLINFLMSFWSTKLTPPASPPPDNPLFVIEPRELGPARLRERQLRVAAVIPTEPLTPRLTLAEAQSRLASGGGGGGATGQTGDAPAVSAPIPRASLAGYLEEPSGSKPIPRKPLSAAPVRLAPGLGRRLLKLFAGQRE